MKISNLLALYLYEKKKLSLPGLGIFTLDPSVAIPRSGDKNQEEFYNHIHFQQKNILTADDELIDFIRQHTGKIYPLAVSDLEGFIEDGKVMLNLDKFFHLEGIGNLVKNKKGEIEFHPGNIESESFYEYIPESTAENLPASPATGSNKNLLIGLAVLFGIAAVIIGGYFYYQNSNESSIPETVNVLPSDNRGLADTNVATSDNTIVNNNQPIENSVENIKGYKFIIETTPRKSRAIRRYEQLKSYFLDIHMDALNDSSLFKLYFIIDAPVTDTSYIKDSLQRWYNSPKVVIE